VFDDIIGLAFMPVGRRVSKSAAPARGTPVGAPLLRSDPSAALPTRARHKQPVNIMMIATAWATLRFCPPYAVNTNHKNIILGIEMSRPHIVVISLFFVLFLPFAYGAEKPRNLYLQDRLDIALMRCLNYNYSKLGAYKTEDLKDYSAFMYDFYKNQKNTFEGDAELSDFIEKYAGDFYKDNIPIKSETRPPPYNAIFARCMKFYKSEKLHDFIKKSKF
jgi:hypothetical protein